MNTFRKSIPQETVQKIHDASMRVLSEKGIKFTYTKAVEIFKEQGLRTDGQVVYFTEDQVMAALETCPEKFELLGKERSFDVTVGGGRPVMCPAYGPVYVERRGEKKKAVKEDIINFTKLTQTSDVIDVLNPYVVTPLDVPTDSLLLYQQAVALGYGTKPTMCIMSGYETTRKSIQMIKGATGVDDGCVAIGLASALSPLCYDDNMAGSAIALAEENQANVFGCCALPGTTSPITMLGTMVTATAELLSGIVLSQLVRPGAPVVYGNVTASTDMRYVTPAIGSPEAGKIAALSKAMCEFYKIPCRSGGSLSDAKQTDYEAGSESMLVMLPTIAAGVDYIIHACGILDSYNIIGYEKFLLDEQNIRAIYCLLEESSAEDDSIFGLEMILEHEHAGQYLDQEHTRKHLRTELFFPTISLRGYYDLWLMDGKKSILDIAEEAILSRLESYSQPEPISGLLETYLNV